ncbi:MAG: hypothetical protein LBL83_08665 [Clostridiales bacterium]|jgi:hypothetical protein|nr:hypothetical protein [Clostridiales bacterium]
MKKKRVLALALCAALTAGMLAAGPGVAAAPAGSPNFTGTLYAFDLETFLDTLPSSKVRYDYHKLATALQGLVNRTGPDDGAMIYYDFLSPTDAANHGVDIDQYWLDKLAASGKYLSGATVDATSYAPDLAGFYSLVDDFSGAFDGFVLWDENVPATSNAASTAAGAQNLLPVRYDAAAGSLCSDLFAGSPARYGASKILLDLTGKFTGAGSIWDTSPAIPSTGSAKNDVYLWAKQKYLEAGLTNPLRMTYSSDAWADTSEIRSGDQAEVYSVSLPTRMNPGQTVPVRVTMRNVGDTAWTEAGNIRLGTLASNQVPISDEKGGGLNHGANDARVNVRPGESVPPGTDYVFDFKVVAPPSTGNYTLALQMVHDGVHWFGETYARTVEVTNDQLPSAVQELADAAGEALDSLAGSISAPAYGLPNQWAALSMAYWNIGTDAWSNGNVELRSTDDSGIALNPIAAPATAPGQSGVFAVAAKSDPAASGWALPETPGTYTLKVRLYDVAGAAFFGETMEASVAVLDPQLQGHVNVPAPVPGDHAAFISVKVPHILSFRQTDAVQIAALNDGTTTWTDAYTLRDYAINQAGYRGNVAWTDSEGAHVQQAALPGGPVAPGDIAVFEIPIAAYTPYNASGYADENAPHDGLWPFNFDITMWTEAAAFTTVPTWSPLLHIEEKNETPRSPVNYVYSVAAPAVTDLFVEPYPPEEIVQLEGGIAYPKFFETCLANADYHIAQKAFFFDLSPDANRAPNDDPSQAVGTDVATLRALLLEQARQAGNKIFMVSGFVPWQLKYTNAVDPNAMAPVSSEWTMVDIISTYGGEVEADATAGTGDVSNLSVLSYVPLNASFAQADSTKGAKNGVVYDENAQYVLFYMGDYDSASWTSSCLPMYWDSEYRTDDAKREGFPLAWSLVGATSARVPHLFNYIYETATENDYIVAGDNGSGYLNPMKLVNRPDGLPDALETWVDHNLHYNELFDIDIQGFLIAGNSGLITPAVQEAYSRMTPAGVIYGGSVTDNIYETAGGAKVPFISYYDIGGSRLTPDQGKAGLAAQIKTQLSTGKQFHSLRTVLTDPGTVIEAMKLAQQEYPNAVPVDPYTLMRLYVEAAGGTQVEAKVTLNAPFAVPDESGFPDWSAAAPIVVSKDDPTVAEFGNVWGNSPANATYRVLWDEENLYVMEERSSPGGLNLSEIGDGASWAVDASGIFLDLTHSKSGNSYTGGGYSIYYTLKQDGNHRVFLRGDAENNLPIAGDVVLDAEIRADGYTAKLAIPWRLMNVGGAPFQPKEGGLVGFSMLAVTGVGAQVMWVGKGDDKEGWADLLFGGLPGGQEPEEPGDARELASVAGNAAAIRPALFTAATAGALAGALGAAEAALADGEAPQSVLDAALRDLRQALSGLALKDEHRDFKQLVDLLTYSASLNEGKYTTASWGKLQAAVDSAWSLIDALVADAQPLSASGDGEAAYGALADVPSALYSKILEVTLALLGLEEEAGGGGEPAEKPKLTAGVSAAASKYVYLTESGDAPATATFVLTGKDIKNVGTLNVFLSHSSGTSISVAPVGPAAASVGYVIVRGEDPEENVAGIPLDGFATKSVTVLAKAGATLSVADGEPLLEVTLTLDERKSGVVSLIASHVDAVCVSGDGAESLADVTIDPSVAAASVSFYSRFDMNRDGAVDLLDVDIVRRNLGKVAEPNGEWASELLARCDLGGEAGVPDGTIDIIDITLMIAKYEAGVGGA